MDHRGPPTWPCEHDHLHQATAQGRSACIPSTEPTALGRGVPSGGPQGQLRWHMAPRAASVPEGPQGKDCMPQIHPSHRVGIGSLAGSLRPGIPETSIQAGLMQEHRGERPMWRSDFPRAWGFRSGPQGWWQQQGHQRPPPPAPPPEDTTALPGGQAGHRGFLLSTLLPGPFFNQMFLILQEAEQGANLSLISEARPLI